MKLRNLSLIVVGMLATSTVFAASSQASMTPKTQQDQLSYTIGVDLGKNLKSQNLSINADMLAEGVKDALAGSKLKLTDTQMKTALQNFQQKMAKKQQEEFKQVSEDNAKAGADFLAKNKKEKGVVVLPNGLQYKVVKAGNGTPPKANDSVTVDYEGKLVNGQVFDSTYKRGKPATFKVSQVISGWQQALKMMKPGAEWMLYIPSDLAYGKQGVGGPIGPNETLIFKVHLISVNPASAKS
ncbi:MAG: hypothetical protein CMF49_07035 [Legionellales bacterium]|nr:hypothetical protein [Legionellales bacterium]|tara:strand:- start:2943 stop:3662 length:720 start_codon:yes stop_codon:yes gene_type:complete